MFLEIENVLAPEELQQLATIANNATFVDGRISNPHNTAKKNLQIEFNGSSYQESSQIIGNALQRSEEFRNFAFPLKIAPPMICKYDPSMSYGAHSDSAFIRLPQQMLRSDISCTVFLSDPSTYEGGELTIHLGSKPVMIKGKPGSAIVYPSTTLHEVRPVTSGQRMVAITFVESQICDEKEREILYTVNEVAALEGYNISPENRTRLNYVSQCLHRKWST